MHTINKKKHYGKCLVLFVSLALMTGCGTSKVEGPVNVSGDGGPQESNQTVSKQNEEIQDESRALYYDALHLEMEAVATQVSQRLKDEGRHLSQARYVEILEASMTEDIQYMYLGFGDGTFIITPEVELPSNYDVVKRDWYKKALEGGAYTDIYQDAMTQDYICTMSFQVYDEEEDPVVLGIDYILESEAEYTEEVEAYMALHASEVEVESGQETESESGMDTLENNAHAQVEEITFSEAQVETWTGVLHSVEASLVPYEAAQDIQAVLGEGVVDYDQVITLYLATPDGRLIASEDMELPEGYDPRKRPWYEKTLESEGVYISEPYYDILTETYVHSMFIELSSKSEAGWVLGIDIKH